MLLVRGKKKYRLKISVDYQLLNLCCFVFHKAVFSPSVNP
uniref:Uncharacterized protein n=1 Tax=Arundo donax TaxID=35708 RepID=A0A0A9CM99_ARUDO